MVQHPFVALCQLVAIEGATNASLTTVGYIGFYRLPAEKNSRPKEPLLITRVETTSRDAMSGKQHHRVGSATHGLQNQGTAISARLLK